MASSNREVVEQSKVVWLAVKPHAIARVLSEVAPVIRPDYHVVVSAAAGIPIKTLEKVREVKKGVRGWCAWMRGGHLSKCGGVLMSGHCEWCFIHGD